LSFSTCIITYGINHYVNYSLRYLVCKINGEAMGKVARTRQLLNAMRTLEREMKKMTASTPTRNLMFTEPICKEAKLLHEETVRLSKK